MAIKLRTNKNIGALKINEQSHLIMQYADDATLGVDGPKSVSHAMMTIKEFTEVSGLRLNFKKTKGIWLGNCKNLGILKHEGIVFTGNPVKLLGIYAGHNRKKAYELNWDRRIEKIKAVLQIYKIFNLTYFSKVEVIKRYALSKIIFPASLLVVPDPIIIQLNTIFFEFLWGNKKDKLKRNVACISQKNGGLGMVDVKLFFNAIKAAWVPRLLSNQGKWKDLILEFCRNHNFDLKFLLTTNFKSVQLLKNFHIFIKM